MGLVKRTTRLRPRRPHARAVRPRPRALALAGLLTALAALSATSAPAASAAEPGAALAAPNGVQIAAVKTLGLHWVRVFATWPDIEPERGVFAANWLASYEGLFHSLPAGTKVIVDVVGTPSWETGSGDEHTPPANPQEYAAFVGALAQRWAGRVAAFEIWNEEDNASWWAGAPNPAAYTELLKATYPVVKAADPSATVVLGGLTGNDYPFLEGVYAAGGKGYFDAIGVHTDTACNVSPPGFFTRENDGRMIPDSFLAYREVHAVELANGDDKPIWMTEMSWRTSEATCDEGAWAGQKPEGVSEATQASYLAQAYHCLAQDPYVQLALWFPLQDAGAAVSGLIRANGSHKPSFAAMQDYVRHGDQLTESVRRLQRTPDRHIQAGEPHDLQHVPADPRLRARQHGRRADHAGDQRQADPQLHQPGLPAAARRRAALAGRGAHPLRTQPPDVHRDRQAAQRIEGHDHDLSPPAAPSPPLDRRFRVRSRRVAFESVVVWGASAQAGAATGAAGAGRRAPRHGRVCR